MNVTAYLDAQRTLAGEALERALHGVEPLLPPDLLPVVRAGLMTGGKRIRPVLCVAAYSAVVKRSSADASGSVTVADAELARVHDIAASLEMIHAYSLMHDDLPCMDDAPLRRGEPTPHTRFGAERTALAGAALIPLAARQAWEGACRAGLAGSVANAVTETLLDGAGVRGMVGGQALDMLGEGKRLGERELGRLHAWKTGALLTAALRMGALVAEAPAVQVEALTGFGRHMGLAFQIADDILDATSSAEALGKEPSDAELHKSTYVGLLGLEGASRRGAEVRDQALACLEAGSVRSPTLEGLAAYILDRRR